MSGIDEQDMDIPICPVCEERPKYWTLYPTTDGLATEGWIWLYSKANVPSYTSRNRLNYYGSPDLDAIKSVKCTSLVSLKRHIFERGSMVFEVVVEAARREQNERNRRTKQTRT